MSRRYINSWQHPMAEVFREAAVQIVEDVLGDGFSTGWSGSLEELETMKKILEPLNITYVDDMRGEWKLKKA